MLRVGCERFLSRASNKQLNIASHLSKLQKLCQSKNAMRLILNNSHDKANERQENNKQPVNGIFKSNQFLEFVSVIAVVVGFLTFQKSKSDSSTVNCEEKKDENFEVERNTNLNFSKLIRFENDNFELVGTSVKTVTFMAFNAYAIGLYLPTDYLNNESLKTFASKWKLKLQQQQQTPKQELIEEMMEEFSRSSIKKVIRIIPSRSATSSHLTSGWNDALAPNLMKALNNDQSKVNELIDQFKQSLSGQGTKTFPRGTEIDFVLDPRYVQIWVNHMPSDRLNSHPLSAAFVDLYFGTSSRTKRIKEDIQKQLINWLTKM